MSKLYAESRRAIVRIWIPSDGLQTTDTTIFRLRFNQESLIASKNEMRLTAKQNRNSF